MKSKQIIAYIAMLLDIVIVWIYSFFIDVDYLFFLLIIQALLPIVILILYKIKPPKYLWIICGIGIVFAIISTLYNRLGYEKLFLYISLLCHVLLYKYLILKERELFWFFFINAVFAYILIIFFVPTYIQAEKLYYYRNLITGRVINPNHYAIYAVYAAVLSVILLDFAKINRVSKILFSYAIISLFVVLVSISKSRTSLIALMIFTLLFTFKKLKIFEDVKKLNILCWICLIGSFILILLYQWLYKISNGNFMIFGKSFFSGRQTIWEIVFEELKTSWLFGFAHPVIIDGASFQMHNGLLEVLCYFGIVPFLILIALFAFRTKLDCSCNKLVLFGFIAFCFIDTFENLLITSYSNMILIIFLLCRTQSKQKTLTEQANETENNQCNRTGI